MHHISKSAGRTRSRRFRQGTRRNKRLRNVGSFASDYPPGTTLLYHCDGSLAGAASPRHPSMRMKVTQCEQKLVDEVRAGQHPTDHVHVQMYSPRPSLLDRVNAGLASMRGVVHRGR